MREIKRLKKQSNSWWTDVISSFNEIWKFDRRLFLILIVNVLISAVQPFPGIVFSGIIIDGIANGEKFSNILLYILAMFGFIFALTALGIYIGKIKEFLFLKFTDKINNDISKKCLDMDFEQFNDSSFQDSVLLINQLSHGNNYFTSITMIFDTLSQVISLIGTVVIMTLLSTWLLLIALVVVSLQSVLHVIRQKNNLRFQVDTISEQRKLNYMSQVWKSIPAKKDIDLFNLGKYVSEKIVSFQNNMLKFHKHRIKKDGAIEMITYLLSVLFQISAYILIGANAVKGAISVGEFTMGVTSLINFMTASSFVATNMLNFGNSMVYIHRYRAFLKYKSKFDNEEGIRIGNINLNKVEIEFRNVSFRYPNSTAYVLRNINLKIRNNEKLAVVGYNGAGKTTFSLLLMRMYEPTDGEILLNGINVKEINYRDYLRIISNVNQDFFLFPFSIIENIAQKNNITDEEKEKVWELCKKNGMEKRISRMYKGLNTPITKQLFAAGIDLSGGERQKIAILRALFKEAPILVLDEPTAALDPVAEYEIYSKFDEMSNGKLTVYISHRINSTRFCDKIAVLEQGRIMEYGTFEELMKLKGLYYSFYEMQAELYK